MGRGASIQAPRPAQNAFAALSKRLLRFVPSSETAAKMTMAMSAAMIAYSTAVAPPSALRGAS